MRGSKVDRDWRGEDVVSRNIVESSQGSIKKVKVENKVFVSHVISVCGSRYFQISTVSVVEGGSEFGTTSAVIGGEASNINKLDKLSLLSKCCNDRDNKTTVPSQVHAVCLRRRRSTQDYFYAHQAQGRFQQKSLFSVGRVTLTMRYTRNVPTELSLRDKQQQASETLAAGVRDDSYECIVLAVNDDHSGRQPLLKVGCISGDREETSSTFRTLSITNAANDNSIQHWYERHVVSKVSLSSIMQFAKQNKRP